jgi:hypothetical protein
MLHTPTWLTWLRNQPWTIWAVFKIPLSFHYTAWFINIPLLVMIPNIYIYIIYIIYIYYILYIYYIYMASIIPKLIINKVGSGSHCSFESKAYLLQRMTPNVGVSEHPAPKLLKLWTWRIARIAATSQVWPPSSFCQIKIRCSSDR